MSEDDIEVKDGAKPEIDPDVQRVRLAYSNLFSGEAGQVVLEDMGRYCGYSVGNYHPGNHRPHDAVFWEGQRQVYLYVQGMIKKGEATV